MLAGGLLSGPSIHAQPPTMPPLPPPPPMNMPSCPYQLMGQINGIYYWQTRNCPDNGNSGYTQTLNNLPVPCCSNASGSWVCNCGVSVAMSPDAAGEQSATQAQALRQTAVQLLTQASIEAGAACDLPQGTAAELDAKLAAIILECEAHETYLKKLVAAPEVQNSDVRNHKGRVQAWLITVSAMLNYLKNGNDAATVKITNYCDAFLPADRNHKHFWRHATLPLGNGKTQTISNEQQKGPLLPPASIDFDTEANVTVVRGPVVRVNVANVSTADKKAWFQTFKVFHEPPGQPISSFYVGVQVLEPASGVVRTAIFIDRHNFGHRIRIPATGETFLVSSHDDLGISK